MPQYQITNQETGNIYEIDLSKEEYHRASKDLVYCTQLLEQAKAGESSNNVIQQEMQSDFNEVCNNSFRWVDEPIKLLLATYKQHENLLYTGKVSVKKFWEIISNKLNEKAYDVTGQQCKSKLNGLKKTYKNVKDYNNKSGNNKRTWPFEIMDEMFGNKPWVTPILTLDSSSIMSPASPSDSSSSSSNSSNIVIASSSQFTSNTNEGCRKHKKQKVTQDTVLEELLTIMKDNKNERRIMNDEAVIRQDRLLNILEKLANK